MKSDRHSEVKSIRLSSRGPNNANSAPSRDRALTAPFKPTKAERKLVQTLAERLRAKVPAPHFKVEQKSSKSVSVDQDHPDHLTGIAAILNAFGTINYEFADWLLGHLINGGCQATQSKPLEARDLNGAAAAVAGIRPRDETEAMLATQMVAVHAAAIAALRRLKSVETIDQQDSNGSLAIKLLRTFTTQVETLQRLRGKGQQTVRVEHVTVNAGGRAIVGNVTRGAGANDKIEEQPHARQLTHMPGEALPSDVEAHKETVSIASR